MYRHLMTVNTYDNIFPLTTAALTAISYSDGVKKYLIFMLK